MKHFDEDILKAWKNKGFKKEKVKKNWRKIGEEFASAVHDFCAGLNILTKKEVLQTPCGSKILQEIIKQETMNLRKKGTLGEK